MAFGAAECLLLLRSEFVDVGIYVLNRSVLGYELARADFTDSLHSRNVVGGVSAYCKDLDELFGGLDAELFAYLGDVHQLVVASGFAWLELGDVLGYELAVVLVRGYHIHVKPFFFSTFGH